LTAKTVITGLPSLKIKDFVLHLFIYSDCSFASKKYLMILGMKFGYLSV